MSTIHRLGSNFLHFGDVSTKIYFNLSPVCCPSQHSPPNERTKTTTTITRHGDFRLVRIGTEFEFLLPFSFLLNLFYGTFTDLVN